MHPTQNDYRDFFNSYAATHVFTFKPNNPGRPGGRAPIRIEPCTGEITPYFARPLAKYTMAPAVRIDRLRGLFVRTMTLLNRAVLGAHYHRPAFAARRISAVCVIEGLPDNGHLHGLLNATDQLWERIAQTFPNDRSQSATTDPWSLISPGGTHEVHLLDKARDWASYISKDAYHPQFSDNIFFYPQNM